MLRVIVVAALSLAIVAPGSVEAQSLTESIGHQIPVNKPSLTQTASPPASSGLNRRAKGALIGLGVGVGLSLLSRGFYESASDVAGRTIFLGIFGAGIGAAVSGDRTTPGSAGLAPRRRLGAAWTMRF